jgi:hypothetical protein
MAVGGVVPLAADTTAGRTTETNSNQQSAISVRINILNPTYVVLSEAYKLA